MYQQDNGFMRLWIGPTQPVVIIFEAEYAEVIVQNFFFLKLDFIFKFSKQKRDY